MLDTVYLSITDYFKSVLSNIYNLREFEGIGD
jgi:hypothetical protein